MTDAVRFTNPVLAGDRPDPAVIRVGDEYWMTYSSFQAAPGLPLYRSTDLVNWTFEGSALPQPLGNTFAVDIAEHDGRFFVYIPFIPTPWSDLTEPSIFVIHAPSMRGPWSEPIDLGIRGAIDPGHVVGEDGKRYLFVNGVRMVELADDGLATIGELEHVYDGWRYPDHWVTEAYALEGPKLFRRRDWFYLVSAVGGTAGPPTGHMVIVARSRSVHGPWENHPGNPIARTQDASERWWSRGHATILRGPADGWWMVSHGYEHGFRTLGRQVLLEPIDWTDDGWPVAVADDVGAPQRAPANASPQRPAAGFSEDPVRSGSGSGGPSTRRRPARPIGCASTTASCCARGARARPARRRSASSPATTPTRSRSTSSWSVTALPKPACCSTSTTVCSAAWASMVSAWSVTPAVFARTGVSRRRSPAGWDCASGTMGTSSRRGTGCRAALGYGTPSATRRRGTTRTRWATCRASGPPSSRAATARCASATSATVSSADA